MIKKDYLEKNARRIKDDYLKVEIYTDFLDDNFDWTIYGDDECWRAGGINCAVGGLNDFIERSESILDDIKAKIFKSYKAAVQAESCPGPLQLYSKHNGDKFKAYDDFFGIHAPDDAYQKATIVSLFIDIDDPSHVPALCSAEFEQPWEPEHSLILGIQHGKIIYVE